MRRDIGRTEIVDRVRHIRNLLRQNKPKDEWEQELFTRSERKTKDFLSNIRRSSKGPMLNMVRTVEEACSLTPDGSHRLFGYEIDRVRHIDTYLNRNRTRIVESYIFERDLRVELPLEFAPSSEFARTATLANLVRRWQKDIPIRVVNRPAWRHAAAFHVRIGIEDSLGSKIPPGSIALVERVGEAEVQQPNPRSTYLLQFANGYRCSRCIVVGGKLQLLTSDRSYFGVERFSYPGSLRIVGRIRGFAVALPLPPPQPSETFLSGYSGSGEFVLPWEEPNREHLFATNYRRFRRSREEINHVGEYLGRELGSRMSDRTRRRYRSATNSEPHVDALIQMSIEHFAPYSDTLRAGGYLLRDKGRFSLESMLHADRFEDLLEPLVRPQIPTPLAVWEDWLSEFVEWPSLLLAQFPHLSRWSERIVRIAGDPAVPRLEPALGTGSWLLTEELPLQTDLRDDSRKIGWSRPLYVLSTGEELAIGHIHTDADRLTLVRGENVDSASVSIPPGELNRLRRVCGALVPV